MDVLDYVNSQGQKAAAFLDAYARTSPVVKQVAEWYRVANESGVLTIFKIVYLANDLRDQFVDIGQHALAESLAPSPPDAFHFPDAKDALEFDPNLDGPVDQVKDMGQVAFEEAKLLAEGELRRQQDAALQDPARLEAEKQDAAQLEAQWEANRKNDELAKQSLQQEAEQKATNSLLEAVRKDQPQDPEIRKLQDEQEKARADRAAQLTEFRDKLAEKYEGSPDQEKHLKEFDKVAQKADETLVREQAAELQKLQEQQRINPPDPSRDR
jgi:hypothetical protein